MEPAPTFKSKIVDSVIEGIIDGTYPSGAIITEKDLIEKYGVSKSPVRDALMELCANQVLRSIPRYGYEIVHINRNSMREMMEYRLYLESQSLYKSINLVTSKNIDDLESLEKQVQKDIRENPDYPVIAHWKNNTEFHLLLVSIARNSYIYNELKRTMNIQMRGYAQYFNLHADEEPMLLNVTCHTYIVEALKNGKAEEAVEGLRKDLDKIDLSNQYSIF